MNAAQAAHLRMLAYLPVTKVPAKERHAEVVNKTQIRGIAYRGKEYPSISATLKALRVSPRTLYRMLAAGEAQRLTK